MTIGSLVASACQPPERAHEDESSGEAAPRLHAGHEMRLASPGDLERFGFRGDGAGFTADHATHGVRVDAGALRVTPRHRGQAGAPIEIETTSIAHGDSLIDITPLGTSVDAATGRLDVTRTSVTERFTNFEGGVEQSWLFDTAPTGDGDLVVEVAVLGHDHVSTTERGLHFAPPAGGLGFRYSHALWIPADGEPVDIAVTYEGGAIRIAVPEDALATTTWPAVLDPVIEPEQAIDTPVIGGTGQTSDSVAVAWNGWDYLAVWRDQRSGQAEVRAARVDHDGVMLDPTSFAVSAGSVPSFAGISAAWNGDHYLVVWADTSRVRLARVGLDGSVTQIADTGVAGQAPSYADIATRNGQALIAFMSNGNLMAAHYDGTAIAPPVLLGTGNGRPRVAVNPWGGEYLVVHNDSSYDVRGRIVSSAGVPGTSVLISSDPGNQWNPDVGFSNANFIVVWADDHLDTRQIRGIQVSPSGALVGSTTAVSAPAYRAGDPSINCPFICLVVWTGGDDIDLRGKRINTDLSPAGTEEILAAAPGSQGLGAAAGGGGFWFVAWQDSRGGITEVFGRRADDTSPGFVLGEERLLAAGTNRQHGPSVGAGSSWLVAWNDTRNAGIDILGRRVSLAGSPLGTAAKVLGAGPGFQIGADVAWNGSRFLAAWSDWRTPQSVRGTRIEPNGTVVDPAGLTLVPDSSATWVRLAGGPAGEWLATWSSPDVMSAVVHADGTISSPVQLSPAGNQVNWPAVAYSPTAGMYLVVWADQTDGGIRAARVLPSGTPLDATPVAIGGTASAGPVDVVYGVGQFFAVWADWGGSDQDIRGSRIQASGSGIVALDGPSGLPLAVGPGNQLEPSCAFAAKSYIVVWTDTRNQATAGYDIYGLQVAPSGAVPDGELALANGPENEMAPAIAGATQGRVLLAYQKGFGLASRAYVRRLVADYPDGATCTSGDQCESGFCTDGRCCNQACGGTTVDCQACSAVKGATADGVCTVLAAGKICRARADTTCDLAERCDGVSTTCPDDLGQREGQVCNAACGAVCPLNDPSGSPHVCPTCP